MVSSHHIPPSYQWLVSTKQVKLGSVVGYPKSIDNNLKICVLEMHHGIIDLPLSLFANMGIVGRIRFKPLELGGEK